MNVWRSCCAPNIRYGLTWLTFKRAGSSLNAWKLYSLFDWWKNSELLIELYDVTLLSIDRMFWKDLLWIKFYSISQSMGFASPSNFWWNRNKKLLQQLAIQGDNPNIYFLKRRPISKESVISHQIAMWSSENKVQQWIGYWRSVRIAWCVHSVSKILKKTCCWKTYHMT